MVALTWPLLVATAAAVRAGRESRGPPPCSGALVAGKYCSLGSYIGCRDVRDCGAATPAASSWQLDKKRPLHTYA